MDRVALVHYHEIGLKGRNRSDFERRLEFNLRRAVRGLGTGRVRRISSRLVVPIADETTIEDVLDAVRRTPGVSHVALAFECDRTPEAIESAAMMAVVEERARLAAVLGRPPQTFAVQARRSATDYPVPSAETNRRVGDVIRVGTGLGVDLRSPDVRCWIEIVQARAYVYSRRVQGPGGLPVGVSGTVVALMSAGIDSPVAAWRMMRRGARVSAVHFSGRPQTSGRSERYAAEITAVLERSGGMERLYIVPFGEVQRRIALTAPEDYRVLLYRRLMVRVAERIAERDGARALVTGESLGQVASQTLDNIAAIDAAATMAVLRPLIGSDKQEIVGEARAIGTFDLSTGCDDDCCTLFMPRRPATHATVAELDEAEALLDIESLVADALCGMMVTDFSRASRRSTNAETGRGTG